MKPPVFDPDWPDDVQALYRHDVREIWDRRIAPHVWNQYHNQLDLYCRFADGREPLDVLDVGCAQATLALTLAERGHRVCALDIRQQFLEYAATRYERGTIRFVRGNALEPPLTERFDLIFANQLLEHLVRPADLVATLARRLRRGGRLVATTPNWHYVKNALPSFGEIGDPRRHEHAQFSSDADGHFFAYRGDELAAIFARAGLASVRVEHFESPWISGHMKVRHLHGACPVPLLRALDRLLLAIPGVGRRMAHQLLVTGEAA